MYIFDEKNIIQTLSAFFPSHSVLLLFQITGCQIRAGSNGSGAFLFGRVGQL